MTTTVQNIIRSYESMPETEKRELAYEILRRSMSFNFPPLSDEELVMNAEALFLELDQRESENGGARSR
jgi:hypothetical protein